MDATNLHPTGWREWRRLRALQLKDKGWYHRLIAEALGVSEATVSRWFARAGAEGPEALLAHPAPGHPPKLSAEQKRLIPDFLWHGAEAYGFRGEVWTCVRVAKVIAEEFGVTYHKDHVSRSGPNCGNERGASVEPWFSSTKRGSTFCRGKCGRMLPRDSDRSCTNGK